MKVFKALNFLYRQDIYNQLTNYLKINNNILLLTVKQYF
jgi:hypothetical protein